ncbi:MAG: hypothetical protein AMJ84_00105 [Acidithiobacillales bacterium SM23_46]|nr:MAG: hypothetical protein AMJ84_00105 [Acidithiobacillales bacterium SM23_46]KPL28981.1 MAG: hypothetical protein AMJ72_00010 [Acidithiobacillales bacterium SM1_46]
MIGCEEFIEGLKRQKPADGFGLVFVDPRRSGVEVIQVENPSFAWPLPVEDMDRCRRLLVVSPLIADDLVSELNASPVETMVRWYRFAMWEERG